MPHTLSAAKRARQAEKRRLANKAVKTKIKNIRRSLFEAIQAKDKNKAEELLKQYSSVLDRAARKGVIGKNTSARRKSRAALQIAKISVATTT
mgnify:CR=1 FL=1